MNNLLVLPILAPLVTAGLCLALRRHPFSQGVAAVLGSLTHFASAIALLLVIGERGMLTLQAGGWEAPVGITLIADPLATILLCLTGVMSVAVTFFIIADVESGPQRRGLFPLLHVLLTGVSGSFLTADLFNLYVWFEVLLIASFGLVARGAGRAHVEGAVKSMTLNLIGSAFFLIAAGATYGMAGTLNMADLHVRLSELYETRPEAVTAVGFTLLLAFSLKSAFFPLYFWLPASYHVPSAGVCAIFAALLTKVGIYSIVRIFTLPFAAVESVFLVVLALAAITMISGVLGAVAQNEIKRILAWHSISQVGYIAVGFGLLAARAEEVRVMSLSALIFFIVHHGLVKPTLFLISGLVERTGGTTRLKPNGGMLDAQPVLGAAFLLTALSLAGVPPLSGFWAKLAVVQATVRAEAWWTLAVALAAGLLTLLSMLKIWMEVFWKPRPEARSAAAPSDRPYSTLPRLARIGIWAPTVGLVLLISAISVWPQPLLSLANAAAVTALHPQRYVEAIGRIGPSRVVRAGRVRPDPAVFATVNSSNEPTDPGAASDARHPWTFVPTDEASTLLPGRPSGDDSAEGGG
jgi:multicomponent Na+:H+ antiporter subunit D